MSISDFIDSVKEENEELANFDGLIELADNDDEEAMFKVGIIFHKLLNLAENSENPDTDLCDDLRDSMEDYMYNSAELGYIDAQEWVNAYRDEDENKWIN